MTEYFKYLKKKVKAFVIVQTRLIQRIASKVKTNCCFEVYFYKILVNESIAEIILRYCLISTVLAFIISVIERNLSYFILIIVFF